MFSMSWESDGAKAQQPLLFRMVYDSYFWSYRTCGLQTYDLLSFSDKRYHQRDKSSYNLFFSIPWISRSVLDYINQIVI